MQKAHHTLELSLPRLVLVPLILILRREIVHYHQMMIKIKIRMKAFAKLKIIMLPLKTKYLKNLE